MKTIKLMHEYQSWPVVNIRFMVPFDEVYLVWPTCIYSHDEVSMDSTDTRPYLAIVLSMSKVSMESIDTLSLVVLSMSKVGESICGCPA